MKAIRSLETGRRVGSEKIDPERIREKLITPNPDRILYLRVALEAGYSVDELYEYTKIDRWFLRQLEELAQMALRLRQEKIETITPALLEESKRMGFSDQRLAVLMNTSAEAVRGRRKQEKIIPVFKRVDTCAAEFESFTPYLYSTYERECEANPTDTEEDHYPGKWSEPDRAGN